MEQETFVKNLRLIIADNYEQMSKCSASLILKESSKNKNLLICVATGSTPTLSYDLLAEKYKSSPQIFNNISFIKLDEWGGIPLSDPATCETYLQQHLISPLNINAARFISFNSNPDNPKQEVKNIEKKLFQKGDIDLCILGMGINGHLGFNEPSSFLQAGAHVAELADATMHHTMAQQAKHKIKYGLTLGMNNIMRSKKILLLVNGKHKRAPFKKFLSGKITTQFPATMLWMHPDVTVVCDKEAAADVE